MALAIGDGPMTIAEGGVRMIRPIFSDVAPVVTSASPPEPPPREWTWLNWVSSLLTAPVAALTMAFALAQVGGSALCGGAVCPQLGGHASLFELLYYGPAVVAALTLFLAFFLATYRAGIAVWAVGWTLLVADLAVLALMF